MKRTLILFLTLWSTLFAQSTFCDGWDDGYAAGKKELNDNIYITPICPIPGINEDNYQRGYVLGYEKATGVLARVVTPNDHPSNATFCDGWEKGFQSAMAEQNKSIYIVPICPIAPINADNYESGYEAGYQKGLDKLGVARNNNVITYDTKNKTFCNGWDDGYAAGKKMLNDQTYITPICPIPGINEDNYQRGYALGYEKATGVEARVVTPNNQPSSATFCDGWEKGFESAMMENNKSVYIIPICPIPGINQDNYQIGFDRGYNRGLEDLGVKRNNNIVVYNKKWKTFCDGWEEGYDYGLNEWASVNNLAKPIKITPICPIPAIQDDHYMKGFELGRVRALEDMK